MVLQEDAGRVEDIGAGRDRARVGEADVGPSLDGQRDVVQAGRVQLEPLLVERLPEPDRARAGGREAQVMDRLAPSNDTGSWRPSGPNTAA